jgi:hypothetical protein
MPLYPYSRANRPRSKVATPADRMSSQTPAQSRSTYFPHVWFAQMCQHIMPMFVSFREYSIFPYYSWFSNISKNVINWKKFIFFLKN